MADTIILKHSATPGSVPAALAPGEVALHLTDHRMFVGGAPAEGYALGCQPIPMVRRAGAWKWVGRATNDASSAIALVSNRIYFLPFMVPRAAAVAALGINVTVAAAGTAQVGIYGNQVVAGNDTPGGLLGAATAINTGVVGVKSAAPAPAITLTPGLLYWAALTSTAACTVSGMRDRGMAHVLGAMAAAPATLIGCLFAAGGGALPAAAPAVLTEQSAATITPAILWQE